MKTLNLYVTIRQKLKPEAINRKETNTATFLFNKLDPQCWTHQMK